MISGIPKLRSGNVLSAAGRAGPRRLLMIGTAFAALAGLVVVVTSGGQRRVIESRDAKLGKVDPLPGGTHSTPEINALAFHAETQQAASALRAGQSYTPPLAASLPAQQTPAGAETAVPTAQQPATPMVVFHAPAAPMRVVLPTEVAVQPEATAPSPGIIPVQAVADPKQMEPYKHQIADLFSQWGGRLPRTEVVTPENDSGNAQGDPPAALRATATAARDNAAPAAASVRPDDAGGRVLIPAGRGVYAHPILALNSDQSSPAVFQADSGPIAGDRMIGSFSRQGDRLIIRVNSIIDKGEEISADGVVIAPDTMEASVASDVDQHYLMRFALPAAAAFVQGLGQAIATTSNTAAVLSPFGGATTTTHLDLNQQLGVAAGAAAGQIGSVLNQAAPKSATVSLEPNVAVGVVFLSNVVSHRS